MVKRSVIFFLSKSGGGKDTQADFLIDKFGYTQISSGDLFRTFTGDEHIDSLDKASLDYYEASGIRSIMNDGKFAPTLSIVCQWRVPILELIKNYKTCKGIIFVGSPRKLGEAMLLQDFFVNWPDAAKYFRMIPILLNVSDKEAARRLLIRRQCIDCRKPISGLPHEATLSECRSCGGKLIKRKDDTPAAINSRLREYQEYVVPVIKYFQAHKNLITVDGNQSIEGVHKDVMKKLGL